MTEYGMYSTLISCECPDILLCSEHTIHGKENTCYCLILSKPELENKST